MVTPERLEIHSGSDVDKISRAIIEDLAARAKAGEFPLELRKIVTAFGACAGSLLAAADNGIESVDDLVDAMLGVMHDFAFLFCVAMSERFPHIEGIQGVEVKIHCADGALKGGGIGDEVH